MRSEHTRAYTGFKKKKYFVIFLFFPENVAQNFLTSSPLTMGAVGSNRASSNSFRKRSFSSSTLRHLSSRSERYFAFLSRYARWTMRERERGTVVSFRLPLVIFVNHVGFVWTPNSQIRRQIKNPNLSKGFALKERKSRFGCSAETIARCRRLSMRLSLPSRPPMTRYRSSTNSFYHTQQSGLQSTPSSKPTMQ